MSSRKKQVARPLTNHVTILVTPTRNACVLLNHIQLLIYPNAGLHYITLLLVLVMDIFSVYGRALDHPFTTSRTKDSSSSLDLSTTPRVPLSRRLKTPLYPIFADPQLHL